MSRRTFSNGTLPSPVDTRDWVFERLVKSTRSLMKVDKQGRYIARSSLPASIDYSQSMPKVYNQGSLPICAGVTAATCKAWQERDKSGTNSFSAMFVYNQRENRPAEGMFGRDVMQILTKAGCCRSSFYATSRKTIDQAPETIPKPAYTDGSRFLIKNYARVTSIEGLKMALHQFGPCYIAFPVFHYGKHFWKPNAQNKNQIGGHAVTVVGYNDHTQSFKIRNSWGSIWNWNGYTQYPYSEFGAHWEIWSLVDAVQPTDDTIPPVPPDNKCKGCVVL